MPTNKAFSAKRRRPGGVLKSIPLVFMLLVLVVGVVAAVIMTMAGGFDLRQKAYYRPPNGTCGPVTFGGVTCNARQEVNGLGCVNSCKCGYTGGACGNHTAGQPCFSNAQCVSGLTCVNGTTGTNGRPGACTSTAAVNPPPAVNVVTTCNTTATYIPSTGKMNVVCNMTRSGVPVTPNTVNIAVYNAPGSLIPGAYFSLNGQQSVEFTVAGSDSQTQSFVAICNAIYAGETCKSDSGWKGWR